MKRHELIEILKEEKKENSEELRYYASFLFKYLPITSSLLLAIFGYALNGRGQLIFAAIPLIINILAVVFQIINQNMILLDGYIRVLEDAINQLLKKKIYQKSNSLVAVIYGGKNQRISILFILITVKVALIILVVYVSSAFYAFSIIREIKYYSTSWIYLMFCAASLVIQVLFYFTMHGRITRAVNTFKSSLEVELLEDD